MLLPKRAPRFFAFLGMIEGLRPAWWVVLVSGLLSMLAAVAYLFVLRQCGRVVLWSMALTVLALIVVVCIACFGSRRRAVEMIPVARYVVLRGMVSGDVLALCE